MAVSKEAQRREAIDDLRLLVERGLDPKILEEFERGIVCFSERAEGSEAGAEIVAAPLGTGLQSLVDAVEGKYGVLVYHAVYEAMSFGPVLYMFYVSNHEDDLEQDKADLTAMDPLLFAFNLHHPESSEFGSAPIKIAGGLALAFE